VLASTAIIESGLDIPAANTMIVDRADLFGLSQLYQLAGASAVRASARTVISSSPPGQLTTRRATASRRSSATPARLRLPVATARPWSFAAPATCSAASQSGFVASVGFDLFCQMLEEATHELRGEPVVHEVDRR